MGLLRTIKSDYELYEHSVLECMVAIERQDCKAIKAYYKKYKGKKDLPKDSVPGFKFIIDEEFDSLKIDFNNCFNFEIKDLKKVK